MIYQFRALSFEISSRIFDCFLLDGEIFAMKTAFAILKFYELELKMSTFEEALNFLRVLPKDTNEDYLFDLIEKSKVKINLKKIFIITYFEIQI